MTRRDELMAVLRAGDGGAADLFARLCGGGWSPPTLRKVIANALRGGSIWVSDLGSGNDLRPRVYTADPSRAVEFVPVRAEQAPRKSLNRTPAKRLTAIAISSRSPLECAWAGERAK